MQNRTDNSNSDGEPSPKRHKPSARLDSTTQSQERNRYRSESHTSNQPLNDAVHDQEGQVQGPTSARDNKSYPQHESEQVWKESQIWTAVEMDRKRRTRSEKQQQEQLNFFASAYATLSVSNNTLRYHNIQLKGAIEEIKKELEGGSKKKPSSGDSSPATNSRLPSQQTIPSNLNQQQLLAFPNTTRVIPQTMPLVTTTLESRPQLEVSLFSQEGAGHAGGNSLVPFGSGEQNFCCNEYMVYCALDPVIKRVYQGALHDPSCSNFKK